MNIKYMSDLHLEFSNGDISVEEYPDDSYTVLVLAGDIGVASDPSTYVHFMEKMSRQFYHVIYVLGNHEYYHGALGESYEKIKDSLNYLNNVHVLDNEAVVIEDTAFLGTTLWTSGLDRHEESMNHIQRNMSDFGLIKNERGNSFTPTRMVSEHSKSLEFLAAATKSLNNYKHVVWVLHHLPSFKSVAERYQNSMLNAGFASDLDSFILDNKPNLIVHGHTHDSFDYKIGDTRVVCNPRGYFPVELNGEFSTNKKIVL